MAPPRGVSWRRAVVLLVANTSREVRGHRLGEVGFHVSVEPSGAIVISVRMFTAPTDIC